MFTESQPQLVLCKPKLLPLKSFTLQKLEKMQDEAKEKAKQQMKSEADFEMERRQPQTNEQVVSESVSFE